MTLERFHAFDRQYHAEAARRSEELRTAVLEALAHEFKTPLTIIRTVESGLLAAGGLSATNRELMTLIDEQSSKLNDLAIAAFWAAAGVPMRRNFNRGTRRFSFRIW